MVRRPQQRRTPGSPAPAGRNHGPLRTAKRPPRRTRTSLVWSALRISTVVLAACTLVWVASTDDQRRRLLVQFGLANSLAQAELTELTLVGPGFRIPLLPALPSAEQGIAARPGGPVRRERQPHRTPEQEPTGGRGSLEGLGRRIGHGGDPCVIGVARNPSRSSEPRPVHRYLDDRGDVVFSDRAPSDAPSELVSVRSGVGVGRFSADYDMDGFTPPLGFRRQLEVDLDGVFHFLADDLRLVGMQPVHLRLRVIDGRARFARLASSKGLQTDSGFYTHRDNLAVVRWMGDTRTRAVARHEIAHLALGNWLGRTPLWLNEGLAEVVETMRFQQNFAIAEAPARRLERLRRLQRAGRLPGLEAFLASTRKQWLGWGNDIAYPYAWSLVHFLLQEPSRQHTVSNLLNALAEHRCRPFDHIGFLNRDYVGGLAGLERDWRRWLDAEAAPLQF